MSILNRTNSPRISQMAFCILRNPSATLRAALLPFQGRFEQTYDMCPCGLCPYMEIAPG